MTARVTVVGLGPAGPELVTAATRAAVERVPHRFLRTRRHPSADVVEPATSFDDLYEEGASLAQVYDAIVDRLATAAADHGEALYAVPGSPAVAERTVELLRADDRVEVEMVPALSFLDLAWVRLGVDPVASGVRVVDGRRFGVEAAGERGPLLVAQCDSTAVLSDVKLAAGDDAPARATVLHRLGMPDERVEVVAWADLDRAVEPDHLTSLWLPAAAPRVAGEVSQLDELVRRLRQDCPWDREQTHASLTRHLLEETYEVLEAIEGLGTDGAAWAHLEEELGDLLFQVVFHATLAAEAGAFTLADVARGIHDKLVARHPHVFGDVEVATAESVMTNWEQLKVAEKGRTSIMDGIPRALPALLYAAKVQRKAASAGVEPVDHPPRWDGANAGDLGGALFALVDAARRAGVDPEAALRSTTAAFRDRFMREEHQPRQ